MFASILDAGERQLGIDLRSTWALTVVRRSLEPLVIGLFFVGWLSTSLTVVGVDEQGLVERLGVPVGGQPSDAGASRALAVARGSGVSHPRAARPDGDDWSRGPGGSGDRRTCCGRASMPPTSTPCCSATAVTSSRSTPRSSTASPTRAPGAITLRTRPTRSAPSATGRS